MTESSFAPRLPNGFARVVAIGLTLGLGSALVSMTSPTAMASREDAVASDGKSRSTDAAPKSIPTRPPNQPPNVVLIISDDQAWTDFGFMGHPTIETPRLDRLADESLVFTRGSVPASLCSPSLASIITGRFPHQHGITGNEPPREPGRSYSDPAYRADVRTMIDLFEASPTVPALLAQHGYRSFQSGKWWLGDFSRGGFTDGMTHGDPTRGGRHGDVGLEIGRSTMAPMFDFIDECVGDPADASDDRPFLVWYAPFLPHTPHDPPEQLLEKYRARTESIHVARYQAMCEWFDETCGRLLDHLDDRGVADDTIVVFVTDNGWIQRPNARGYAPRSKRSPYDGGLRTPIMIRWPAHVEPDVVARPVSSIDIAPTILEACGVEVPETMDGVNLVSRAAVAGRRAIFGDVHRHNAVDLRDPAANVTWRWCIADGWKLIVPDAANVPEGRVELFNLEADPYERNDLAARHPDRVARMRALIDDWWPAVRTPSDP